MGRSALRDAAAGIGAPAERDAGAAGAFPAAPSTASRYRGSAYSSAAAEMQARAFNYRRRRNPADVKDLLDEESDDAMRYV